MKAPYRCDESPHAAPVEPARPRLWPSAVALVMGVNFTLYLVANAFSTRGEMFADSFQWWRLGPFVFVAMVNGVFWPVVWFNTVRERIDKLEGR
jgi:hypothetical protein